MTERVDFRSPSERRVRSAWKGEPGALLRAGSLAFGLAADIRNLFYGTGILRAAEPALPVISVGGLTVGGSGKTPIAATVGRWLTDAGWRVAVITRGFADELAVHRSLNQDARVLGDPDRERAVARAAEAGARVAVLDDGFQHRRLARRVELVLVDLETVARGGLRRLPAGPFRARWAELGRADAIIISRRTSGPETGAEEARRLADRLRSVTSAAVVAGCRISPGRLRPANERARRIERPEPVVAVASIMKPLTFFGQLRRVGVSPEREYIFPDHAAPGAGRAEEMVEAAGHRGMVGTRKDVQRLTSAAAERTPVWYLEDRMEWEMEEERLRRYLVKAVG